MRPVVLALAERYELPVPSNSISGCSPRLTPTGAPARRRRTPDGRRAHAVGQLDPVSHGVVAERRRVFICFWVRAVEHARDAAALKQQEKSGLDATVSSRAATCSTQGGARQVVRDENRPTRQHPGPATSREQAAGVPRTRGGLTCAVPVQAVRPKRGARASPPASVRRTAPRQGRRHVRVQGLRAVTAQA